MKEKIKPLIQELQQKQNALTALIENMERAITELQSACDHEWKTIGGFPDISLSECRVCGKINIDLEATQ